MAAIAPARVTPDRGTVVSAEATASNNNMSVVVVQPQQQPTPMTLPPPPPSLLRPTPQLLDELHDILTVLMTRETSYYDATIHGNVARSRAASWRPIMVSWMHSVVDTFSLMPQLVPAGLYYLDRCAAAGSTCDQLQYPLMAMTCLNLAVKVHETKMFPLDQLVLLLGKSAVGVKCQQQQQQLQERYTPAEIVQMERTLMNQCQWHLHPPTSHEFLLQFGLLLPVHLRSPVVSAAQTHLKHASLWEHVLHQQTLPSTTTTTTTMTMTLPPAPPGPRPFLPSILAYAGLLLAMEDVSLQVPLAVKQTCCQSLLQVAGLSAHTPRLEEAYNYMVLAGSLQDQLVKRRQQQAQQAVPPPMPVATTTTTTVATTIATTTVVPTFGAAAAAVAARLQSARPHSGSCNHDDMGIASSVVAAAASALEQQQQPNNNSCSAQNDTNKCANPTSHVIPHRHDIMEDSDEENQMGAVVYGSKQGLEDEVSDMTVDKVPPSSYWRSTLSPSSSSESESAGSMTETSLDHQTGAEEDAEEEILPLPPPNYHHFSQTAEDEDAGTTISTLSSYSTETIIFYSNTQAGGDGFEVAVAPADIRDILAGKMPLKLVETNDVEEIPELQLVLTESLDEDGVEIAMAKCKYSDSNDLECTLSTLIASPRMVTFH